MKALVDGKIARSITRRAWPMEYLILNFRYHPIFLAIVWLSQVNKENQKAAT